MHSNVASPLYLDLQTDSYHTQPFVEPDHEVTSQKYRRYRQRPARRRYLTTGYKKSLATAPNEEDTRTHLGQLAAGYGDCVSRSYNYDQHESHSNWQVQWEWQVKQYAEAGVLDRGLNGRALSTVSSEGLPEAESWYLTDEWKQIIRGYARTNELDEENWMHLAVAEWKLVEGFLDTREHVGEYARGTCGSGDSGKRAADENVRRNLEAARDARNRGLANVQEVQDLEEVPTSRYPLRDFSASQAVLAEKRDHGKRAADENVRRNVEEAKDARNRGLANVQEVQDTEEVSTSRYPLRDFLASQAVLAKKREYSGTVTLTIGYIPPSLEDDDEDL